MIPGYLSAADIAERLGVRATTVHRYAHRGDMPPPDNRVGRSPLWKEETILAWKADRASASWNRKK